MVNNTEHLLHEPVCHLYVFFGKKFIQIFCPLLNWIVFLTIELYEFFLYILDISTLSIYDLQIFYPIQ